MTKQTSPTRLIAREIRAELARQTLSQRQLALMLGVSPMWCARRLTSYRVVLTVDDVERVAGALGVSVESLLVGWLAVSRQRGVV